MSPMSVIPSSIVVSAIGMDVTWTTNFSKACNPNDNYLRKQGSQYYSCQRLDLDMSVLAPEGLFSIRNSDDWLWWRTFHQFQLTIEATDADYNNANSSGSIEIEDVRLYGWDEPRNECNCHPVGVIDTKLPCSNGNCNCRSSSVSNTQCIPNNNIGLPTYGPVSGGTTSFTMGNYLAQAVNVSLGNEYKCTILRNNDTFLQFKTTAGNASDLHSSIPLRIYWDRPPGVASFIIARWEFTYKPDPVIHSISPLTSIRRGGIPQTVRGENLDSVAFPFITLVFQSQGLVPFYANFTNSYLEDNDTFCHHINSTQLECISPGTEHVPSYYYTGKTKITVSLDINKYIDYTRCEITDQHCDFESTDNPSIYLWSKDMVYDVYNGKKSFPIQGWGFAIGSREEDYTVTVGRVHCQIVSIVTNNIVFYPPDPSNFTTIDDAKQTILAVGYYTFTVGYIHYYLNWIDNPANRNSLIIGLVCGVGGVVIIILAVVLYRTYYKRKPVPQPAHRPYELGDVRYTRPPEADHTLLEYLDSEQRIKVEKILVPFSRIQLGTEIGSGNFGKVCRGIYKRDGKDESVAIKTIRESPDIDFRDKVSFIEEATIMIDFDHRNVLSLIAVVIDHNLPYIVLPLMDHGDLRAFVANPEKAFTVCDLTSYCLQVAEGMEYLARNKFVHRDLAARNCMINKDFVVKVADFGLARDIYEKDYYRTQDQMKPLPVKWMAIECLGSSPKFTESTDVWSFGVLMWELFTRGRRPYSVYNFCDNNELRQFLLQGHRLEETPHMPEFIYKLMNECWKREPELRPRFSDIVLRLKEIMSYALESFDDNRRYSMASVDEASNVNQIHLQVSSYLELMRQSVAPDE